MTGQYSEANSTGMDVDEPNPKGMKAGDLILPTAGFSTGLAYPTPCQGNIIELVVRKRVSQPSRV